MKSIQNGLSIYQTTFYFILNQTKSMPLAWTFQTF